MSIEFACSQCGKILRVGDDAAGKHARCPSCGAVQPVPASQQPASPFGPAPPYTPPTHAAEENPYQAPTSATWHSEAARAGGFQPTVIDAGDVLNRTLTIFRARFGVILGAALIIWALQVGQNVAGRIGQAAMAAPGARPEMLIPVLVGIQLGAFVVDTWIRAGTAILMLKVARGDQAELGDVFSAGGYLLPALGARLLYGLAIIVGLVLFIVPGIFAALMWSQYLYLLVDRRKGVFQALRTSKTLTTGNMLSLLLVALISIALMCLGLCACCIGTIPAYGFVSLMWAVAYVAMSGEATADQLLLEPPPSMSSPPRPELR